MSRLTRASESEEKKQDFLKPIPTVPAEQAPEIAPPEQEAALLRSSTNLRNTKWKWVILGVTTLINFALNYSSNNPQALQPAVEDFFNMGDAEFNILYSVYSLPNIILPLIGGVLTDYLGVRFAVNVFGTLVVIGQGIFAFGAYKESFNVMIAGRFVYGLGGESLTVSQLPFLAKWFTGPQLALAYGITKSSVRLGKAANSFFTPQVYEWTDTLYAPLVVGLGISALSWVGGIVISILDRRVDMIERTKDPSKQQKKKVKFSDIKKMPFIFFLLFLSYACLYGSFIGISNNLNNILDKRFGFTIEDAGDLVMGYYLISAIAGPFVGYIIEKVGKRTAFLVAMTVTLLITNLIFAFISDGTKENPNYQVIIPLIGITIFSAFYTILFWACVALVVDKKVIGTATGIVTCLSNLTLTLIPLALGLIHDHTLDFHHGYFWTCITLSGIVGLGLIFDIWIHIEDKRKGGKLRIPGDKIKAQKLKSEAEPLLSEKDKKVNAA